MYLGMVEEEDNKMVESWKVDDDGILVFVSPMCRSLIFTCSLDWSILRCCRSISCECCPGPPARASRYLPAPFRAQQFHPIIPPSNPLAYSSPRFLSLAISLACGILATLLQQWARRYIKITHTWKSFYKRARICAFFAEGVEKLHPPWAPGALPTLLHISPFLLLLYSYLTSIAPSSASWLDRSSFVALMPLFRRDNTYYAPVCLVPRLWHPVRNLQITRLVR